MAVKLVIDALGDRVAVLSEAVDGLLPPEGAKSPGGPGAPP
jgi:hypothetical protein